MAVLIFALVVLLIVGLALYLLDLIPFDGRLRLAAKVIVLVIAILLLMQKLGAV